jgi:circadian clock protein KaiB
MKSKGKTKALARAGEGPMKLRLYVAGHSPNSTLAAANLAVICQRHLAGGHTLEIVDVLQEPQRALAEGIVVTPTLLKISPSPEIRIIGALSETKAILLALGLNELIGANHE